MMLQHVLCTVSDCSKFSFPYTHTNKHVDLSDTKQQARTLERGANMHIKIHDIVAQAVPVAQALLCQSVSAHMHTYIHTHACMHT
jgi:hypothetical protein